MQSVGAFTSTIPVNVFVFTSYFVDEIFQFIEKMSCWGGGGVEAEMFVTGTNKKGLIEGLIPILRLSSPSEDPLHLIIYSCFV